MKECTCMTRKKCSIHPCLRHQSCTWEWTENGIRYVQCLLCYSVEVKPIAVKGVKHG